MDTTQNSVRHGVLYRLWLAIWPQTLLGRLLAVVCYVVIVGNIAALTVLYNQSAANVERTERVRLRSIVVPLAQQIDGDMHEAIARQHPAMGEVHEWSNGSDELRYAQQQLHLVARHLGLAGTISTIRLKPDRLGSVYADYKSIHPEAYELILSSADKPDWRASRNYAPRMARAQFARMIASSGIYADESGRWISAYAPIIDSNDDVVGLLEVRSPVEELFEEVRLQAMQQGSLIAVIVLTIILGIAYVTGRLGRDLYAIERAAEQLGRGNLTKPIDGGGGPEVQRLAKSMEFARRRLQKNSLIIDKVRQDFERRLEMVRLGFDFAGHSRRKQIATAMAEMGFALQMGTSKPVKAAVIDLDGPRWSFRAVDPSATLWRRGMELDIRIDATMRRPEVVMRAVVDSVYWEDGGTLIHLVLLDGRFEELLSPAVVRILDRRENVRVMQEAASHLSCTLLVHLTGDRREVVLTDICRTGVGLLVTDSVADISRWGPNVFVTIRFPSGQPEKVPAEIRYVRGEDANTRLGLEFDDDFLKQSGVPTLFRFLNTEERVQR
jgi:hypothetical protein